MATAAEALAKVQQVATKVDQLIAIAQSSGDPATIQQIADTADAVNAKLDGALTPPA